GLLIAWGMIGAQRPYGDGDSVVDFLNANDGFPRWLVGITLAITLYRGVWLFPPFAAHLSAVHAHPAAFAGVLCAVVMCVSSIAILRAWPNRLAVVLPMLTPLWILFTTGYIEYYPLMIGAWLASIAWLMERPWEERSPV